MVGFHLLLVRMEQFGDSVYVCVLSVRFSVSIVCPSSLYKLQIVIDSFLNSMKCAMLRNFIQWEDLCFLLCFCGLWGSKASAKLLVKREIAGVIAAIHIKTILPPPPFNLRYRPSLIWIASITERNINFHLLERQHVWQECSFAMQSGLVAPFISNQAIPFHHFSSCVGPRWLLLMYSLSWSTSFR